MQDYTFAVSQVAQTSLRSVIGQSDMDQLLSEREKVNAHLKEVIDQPTEKPLGYPGGTGRGQGRLAARVDETLHVTAGRSQRERRARIISADGEYQASKKLAQAAAVMAADPAALQLRLLQTVVEVAAEKNSTLVMPVPVELLRFFDRAARDPGRAGPPEAATQDADALPRGPQRPPLRCRPAWPPASP